MENQKYKMRVIRGAFIDPKMLDKLGVKSVQKLERNEWQSIDEVIIDLEQIRKLQNNMIRHYDDTIVPWYMDGYGIKDKNDVVVAFGADDGEGGKIFKFAREDKKAIREAVEYGIGKGIPKKEMDFIEIDF